MPTSFWPQILAVPSPTEWCNKVTFLPQIPNLLPDTGKGFQWWELKPIRLSQGILSTHSFLIWDYQVRLVVLSQLIRLKKKKRQRSLDNLDIFFPPCVQDIWPYCVSVDIEKEHYPTWLSTQKFPATSQKAHRA